ncbi:MAG: nuclear transport factor 2 family protein [Caulobacteraceae bacterium]|nr:MAG: nuclear transport factor 2 family protein [Caulobacteraceae bacterium]
MIWRVAAMTPDDLERLLARQEITEQLHRYCRAMDRIDNDLGKRVWHHDGTADFGELYRGTGAGWVEQVSVMHRTTCLTHSHMVSNILIEVDGATAASECLISAILVQEPDGRRIVREIRGRYLDRWSRRDGRWAIDHRHYVRDHGEVRDLPGDASLYRPWGRRDRDDPSYGFIPNQ